MLAKESLLAAEHDEELEASKFWLPLRRPHHEQREPEAAEDDAALAAQEEGRQRRSSTVLSRAKSTLAGRARAVTGALTGVELSEDAGEDSRVPLLLLSVQLVPSSEVEKLPAGFGRSAPNCNPVLPKQVGRLKFSLNPCRMAYDVLGPKLCGRLSGLLCLIVCVLVLWGLIPVLIGNVVTAPITG